VKRRPAAFAALGENLFSCLRVTPCTLHKVQADILQRDATVMALTSFCIADRPERLASPWPAERTARMLIEKHDDVMRKAYNLRPFGNL
jgi:hypothetical protein